MASALLKPHLLRRFAGRSIWSLGPIKAFPDSQIPGQHILSVLETSPPVRALAVGTVVERPGEDHLRLPPPDSFTENPRFRHMLNQVIAEFGHLDSQLQAQAKAFVGSGATSMITAMQRGRHRRRHSVGTGGSDTQPAAAPVTSAGYIHLSDTRNPPEFGRIASPEDILGSVEVNTDGEIIGTVEPSGTYRILTNEGILGLSPFLMEKLTERIRAEQNTQVKQS